MVLGKTVALALWVGALKPWLCIEGIEGGLMLGCLVEAKSPRQTRTAPFNMRSDAKKLSVKVYSIWGLGFHDPGTSTSVESRLFFAGG